MIFGVVVFPGSNCDHDCYHVSKIYGDDALTIWHDDQKLPDVFYDQEQETCLILPGGFSYGDYLRSGAIASFSKIIKEIKDYSARGGLIIGICNGFQVLTEIGLLPGALYRNKGLKFICKDIHLKVETNKTRFTNNCQPGDILTIPIAHGEGNYYCDQETLQELINNDQIVFRYSTSDGLINDEANPNGSVHNIAGVCNSSRNVLGMMPHPERCAEEILGNIDGSKIFESIMQRS